MKPLLFAMPGNEDFTGRLIAALGAEPGSLEMRRFPDGETYVRLASDVDGRSTAFVCTLDRPNDKTLPLLFTAHAARDLGASRVGLVAPYLGYMRQDKRFRPGEAITSSAFGSLLSSSFDWIVTVDPHLHRRTSMSEIYAIPVAVCHAAPKLSAWIREHAPNALVIGPDVESEQWVSTVAADAGVPCVTLEKTRRGDRDVEIKLPDLEAWRSRTPVLVDDIISSGRTMEVAIRHLSELGFSPPICLGIHGLFADDAFERLEAAGASSIVCTNTVSHKATALDVSDIVAKAMSSLVQ
ncbi:MAG: ribose-phosphate pyrophosphokinase [Hyphomicrobium sp.]|uniref:ribose-phosphate pyrophosphokinase n=1 Tax=Hyphomicrobium sp. TaxID=82 RepID=UPI0013249AC3|nr:ribose-phosphate pyrophosphokinase [Hyphomicrobium sp.]KAB2943558.1 MAG: ribose-phosphate pyrophosphokinase [Hyphomicrobium sp.]MBZ0209722.1 ribose-phosphate pyrophosphokinase [Hyphomicrobium sp.]